VLYECKKYGKVDKIYVERNSSTGNVWVSFLDMNSARRAIDRLNGRFFNKKQINAIFVTQGTMKAHMR
jgi:hypothetical protein